MQNLQTFVPAVFTPMRAKHSKSLSLIDCISAGVDWMRILSKNWNCQHERCTSSRVVFDVYCSPVCLDNALANTEAQTVAASFPGSGQINSKEGLENVSHVRFGNPLTVVLNTNEHTLLVRGDRENHRLTIWKRVFQGVVE